MSKPLVQESHASPETTGGRRWRWRYALTVGIVALATALRWGLDSLFGPGVAFITFFPAVGIVAMIAGGRAGVLATILSAVAAEWLFLGSGYRLTHSALGDLVGLGLFVAAGVLISVTAGMLGRARKREWEAAEREKAAGKVREWEQRLNYALETSQIGAWELNLNDQTAHRSLQHDRIFGYSELLPRWTYDMFLEHVLPEDRAMVDRKFREAVEAGTDWSFECRVRRADQQVRWIWASGRHRSDAAGTRCGLAGIVQDITERKQAQEDLRKSEEQLRVAATAAEIGMWSWRPGTDQVVVSANWRQLFGVSPDAAVTFATWSNALHPDDREDVVRELNAASQEHREFSVEYRAVHSDGTIRWIIDRGRAWYDDQGRPAGMAGVNVDITKRKQAEQEQQRLAAQRQLALDAARLGWWHYDPASKLVTWDERYREIFGVLDRQRPIEEILTRLHPDDVPPVRVAIEAALNPVDPKPFFAEFRILRDDRSVRWVEARGIATFEGKGDDRRPTSLVGTVQDITERKQFQAELERLVAERTAKLQELVTELEHFSYTITHDMRAPLRAMQGFADLMSETCGSCSEQEPKGFLRRIRTSASRMDSLITDALNYSRTVRQELTLLPVDAGALLRGMLDSYPELQPSKARVEIKGDIPLVMGNEAGLTQCFSNLLNNAVKFVKPGNSPQIRIWGETRGQWVRIWIEDDGIGIPQSMNPRIFDMFSRGHQSYEGTGIGLALVRKVMDRMGGKVGVESQEGRGSRFWLDLKSGDTRAAYAR